MVGRSKSGPGALRLSLACAIALFLALSVNAGGFLDAKMRMAVYDEARVQDSQTSQVVDSKCGGEQPSLPQFVCVNGVWTSPVSIVLEKTDLVIKKGNGFVAINGSLTFSGLAKVILSERANGVNVSDCIVVAKKPATVVVNFGFPSPYIGYEPLISHPSLSSTPACHSQAQDLTFNTPNPGSCKQIRFQKTILAGNSSAILDIQLNSGNCTVITITIGVVGGALGLSIIVAIVTIFFMKKKNSGYAQLSDYAEDTPIRRSHGMH